MGDGRFGTAVFEEISLHHARIEKKATVDRIAHVLDAAMSIDVGDLEKVVQQAHECNIKQIGDPPEPFGISRQSLRMFWHFRCNIEAVEIHSEKT